MDTKIRDFCIKYKEKLKTDKDIKENKLDACDDFRDRINFNLNIYISSPREMGIQMHNGQNLFRLDSEDLEYLYEKYSKKLNTEMNENITEIKDSYKDAF